MAVAVKKRPVLIGSSRCILRCIDIARVDSYKARFGFVKSVWLETGCRRAGFVIDDPT